MPQLCHSDGTVQRETSLLIEPIDERAAVSDTDHFSRHDALIHSPFRKQFADTNSGRKHVIHCVTIVIAAIKVILRGKANAEWKVVVSGERRTVKDEQTFIEDRALIWGKGMSLP